jgi:phosphatidylglycerol lysyltransferase
MTASESAPSAATVTPDLPPAAKKTGAFAAYLRANPFSVILALIVLGTGLGFGTFWGGVPG